MRYQPDIIPPEKVAAREKKLRETTRKAAIALVFAGTYYFFIKLLFL